MVKYTCDVLCLGGGGAGITAAVKAAGCGAEVILVSKEPLGYGDTRISMGLIANPGMVEGDDGERFFQDLVLSGEYINDFALARIMAERATEAREILEGFGHLFQRDGEGCISAEVAFLSGGHSRPRTLGCPPGSGIGIGHALRAAVARAKIRVLEETLACRLLTDGLRVVGATCYDIIRGETILISAKTVIIATGGAGWLYYPHTDCTAGATGDGYALAYDAGAELTDMEQVQFIPFGLTHPSSMCGVFVGEPSLAAPNGVLRNNRGEIILENVAGMTRAQVTRAIATELTRSGGTEHGGLLLDLTPNLASEEGRKMWERRKSLGQLDAILLAYGEKAYRWEEPWDIAPTAHYTIGGIKVNSLGQSTVPGLYAIGQAMGGIHGANRLGAVSLAELFVFGEIAGEVAAAESIQMQAPQLPADAAQSFAYLQSLAGQKGRFSPLALQRRLQKLLWDKVGIAREDKGLREALAEIAALETAAEDLVIPADKTYNREVVQAIELKHMLKCARMIAESALLREETRGAHLRLDFPEKDEADWRCNIVLAQTDGRLSIRREAVADEPVENYN